MNPKLSIILIKKNAKLSRLLLLFNILTVKERKDINKVVDELRKGTKLCVNDIKTVKGSFVQYINVVIFN